MVAGMSGQDRHGQRCLAVLRGSNGEFNLGKRTIRIGRDPLSDVVLAGRGGNRDHATIHFNSATHQFELADLGSLNGTFINDIKIKKPTVLCHHDTIRFGASKATFRFELVPGVHLQSTSNSVSTPADAEPNRWVEEVIELPARTLRRPISSKRHQLRMGSERRVAFAYPEATMDAHSMNAEFSDDSLGEEDFNNEFGGDYDHSTLSSRSGRLDTTQTNLRSRKNHARHTVGHHSSYTESDSRPRSRSAKNRHQSLAYDMMWADGGQQKEEASPIAVVLRNGKTMGNHGDQYRDKHYATIRAENRRRPVPPRHNKYKGMITEVVDALYNEQSDDTAVNRVVSSSPPSPPPPPPVIVMGSRSSRIVGDIPKWIPERLDTVRQLAVKLKARSHDTVNGLAQIFGSLRLPCPQPVAETFALTEDMVMQHGPFESGAPDNLTWHGRRVDIDNALRALSLAETRLTAVCDTFKSARSTLSRELEAQIQDAIEAVRADMVRDTTAQLKEVNTELEQAWKDADHSREIRDREATAVAMRLDRHDAEMEAKDAQISRLLSEIDHNAREKIRGNQSLLSNGSDEPNLDSGILLHSKQDTAIIKSLENTIKSKDTLNLTLQDEISHLQKDIADSLAKFTALETKYTEDLELHNRKLEEAHVELTDVREEVVKVTLSCQQAEQSLDDEIKTRRGLETQLEDSSAKLISIEKLNSEKEGQISRLESTLFDKTATIKDYEEKHDIGKKARDTLCSNIKMLEAELDQNQSLIAKQAGEIEALYQHNTELREGLEHCRQDLMSEQQAAIDLKSQLASKAQVISDVVSERHAAQEQVKIAEREIHNVHEAFISIWDDLKSLAKLVYSRSGDEFFEQAGVHNTNISESVSAITSIISNVAQQTATIVTPTTSLTTETIPKENDQDVNNDSLEQLQKQVSELLDERAALKSKIHRMESNDWGASPSRHTAVEQEGD